MRLRRVVCGLLGLAALATTAATTPPASAHEGVCAVHGTMALAAGLSYRLPGVPATTTGFAFSSAPCTAPSASSFPGIGGGTMTGWCHDATATGDFAGHGFTATVVGLTITFVGGVVGTLSMIPDPTTPGSCLTGTMLRFLVDGELTVLPHPPIPCTFAGTMTTHAGLHYNAPTPAGGPSRSTGMVSHGSCDVPAVTGTLSATVAGWCDDASGSGLVNFHPFTYTLTGTTMTLSGNVVGTLQVVPDAGNGHSCDGTPGNPGASQFLLSGTVALV